ncbi:LexA family transcriptional regulator [Halobacteriovorax sp. HLS]|uniref:LexA family protein n=1 Tax=Halobacteriovorax sp. HLS TaxID=2234000 RepID=UPI000FD828B3|nr:translesion error-prone DNA polymerase V autoproteolytic subunit [Halobacteriovorax sp. HLS]
MKDIPRFYSLLDLETPLFTKLFGTHVSCGFPSPADDYLEGKLSLDSLLVQRPNSTFFVKAEGQSMEPLILSGDLLIIDRSVMVRNGDIILGIVDGEFSIKRFFRDHEKVILTPENEKFNPIVIKDELRFEVWGVVIHIIHSLVRRSL